MTLDKPTLETLLRLVMHLEHTALLHEMNKQDYWAIVNLAQAVEAPQFITEHFARKALNADE
jgi:hypothetical protein